MTPAQEDLRRRQQKKPPKYALREGRDRVRQLYDALRPKLPTALAAMVEDGTVAVGEVGDNLPGASMTALQGGGFVVVLTSGMMDFQYAVARALAGLGADNAQLPARPRTVDEIAALVKNVLRRWARYMKWWFVPTPRVQWADFPITRPAHEFIENIVTVGELHLLAHELGHVALRMKLVPRVSDNEESDADHYGLHFLLSAAEARWHKRFAFAGPIIPIRIFAAMQRLGVQFSDRYPPPSQRLEALRRQIRALCPSAQYYYEASTIMVAYQDMIDDIENKMDPGSTSAPPDPERMLVRLIAELEEVGHGHVSIDTMQKNIRTMANVIPHATIKAGTKMLIDQYRFIPKPEDTFVGVPTRVLMATKLDELVTRLPGDLKPLFP